MPGPRNQNTGVKLPRIIKAPKGKVLVIAPHPDDESCGIGGTIALHREQDDAVLVCYLTDGRSGDPDGRHGDGFVALRMAEAREAARILGGLELDFFGFPDNRAVNEKDLRMVCERLDSVARPYAPDLVYVPWSEETHSDHAHACSLLDLLLDLWGKGGGPHEPRVLQYEVWSPLPADCIIDISKTAEKKRMAMLAHKSQVAYTDYPHQLMGLAAHRSVYLPKTSRYGEAFREGRGSSPR